MLSHLKRDIWLPLVEREICITGVQPTNQQDLHSLWQYGSKSQRMFPVPVFIRSNTSCHQRNGFSFQGSVSCFRQSLPNTHILKAWHCRKRVQLSLETSNCWASKMLYHVRICLLSNEISTLLVYISSTKNTASKWSESTFSALTLFVAQAFILLIEAVAFCICNALGFLLPNRSKSPRNNQCLPSASLTFFQHQLWVAHL